MRQRNFVRPHVFETNSSSRDKIICAPTFWRPRPPYSSPPLPMLSPPTRMAIRRRLTPPTARPIRVLQWPGLGTGQVSYRVQGLSIAWHNRSKSRLIGGSSLFQERRRKSPISFLFRPFLRPDEAPRRAKSQICERAPQRALRNSERHKNIR